MLNGGLYLSEKTRTAFEKAVAQKDILKLRPTQPEAKDIFPGHPAQIPQTADSLPQTKDRARNMVRIGWNGFRPGRTRR